VRSLASLVDVSRHFVFSSLQFIYNHFPREKLAKGVGFVRDWYVIPGGVIIGWLAWSTRGGYSDAQSLVASTAGGPVWNGLDGLHILLLLPELIRQANQLTDRQLEKKITLVIDVLYSVCLEQIGTNIPYSTVVADAKKDPRGIQGVLWECDYTLGDPKLLPWMSFSFAGGEYWEMLKSMREAYVSHQSSDQLACKKHLVDTSVHLTCGLGALFAGLSMIAYPRLFVTVAPLSYSLSLGIRATACAMRFFCKRTPGQVPLLSAAEPVINEQYSVSEVPL